MTNDERRVTNGPRHSQLVARSILDADEHPAAGELGLRVLVLQRLLRARGRVHDGDAVVPAGLLLDDDGPLLHGRIALGALVAAPAGVDAVALLLLLLRLRAAPVEAALRRGGLLRRGAAAFDERPGL